MPGTGGQSVSGGRQRQAADGSGWQRMAADGILISEGDPWDAFEEGCRSLDEAFFDAVERRDRKTPQVRDFNAGLP